MGLPLDQQIRDLRSRVCLLEKTMSGTSSSSQSDIGFKRIQFTIGAQDAQDLIDSGDIQIDTRSITILNPKNVIEDSLSFTLGGSEIPKGLDSDAFFAYTNIIYTTNSTTITFNADLVDSNLFIAYLSYKK